MTRRHLLVPAALLLTLALVHAGRGHFGERPRVALAPAAPPAPLPADAPDEVEELLRNGQNWRAAREMRRYLDEHPDDAPEMVLLAARAEAGWGGWERVRSLLDGRPWLDTVGGGEGWYLLARAREEDRDWAAAGDAYRRFRRVTPAAAGDHARLTAGLRQGLILLRTGSGEAGADTLEAIRGEVPELAPWIALLSAEALVAGGDTARIRSFLPAAEEVAARRARVALVRAHAAAGDARSAGELALAFRRGSRSDAARGEFGRLAGEYTLQLGDTAGARDLFLAALRAAPGTAAGRAAADRYVALGSVPAEQRLALGRVREAQGDPARAATNYRLWLTSGRGTASEREQARLRLARFLFASGDYGAAADEAARLDDAAPATAAAAMYLRGRAEYRRGNPERAVAIWRRLADRFPQEKSAADALFLVADLRHDDGEIGLASQGYRAVADRFPGTSRAALALMRLGGIAMQGGDPAGAARVWEEYRARYPGGSSWPQATYWAGRAYLAAGDRDRAAARFREVSAREPLSYYALRAAERLGEAFWPVPLGASPPDAPDARARVEEWLGGVELLRAAGLPEEAEAEAGRLVERAGDDPELLYPLAEGLNARGYTVRGVNLGYRLLRDAGRQNSRLLRIVYPFPYRGMVAAEAEEAGLDPFLVAALIRQESVFKARIASPVGARGLMQIMPETGSGLAAGSGIRGWSSELLYNPEINVHLGVRYLAEQMREYRGSLPSVFSAYNAGPARVERWRDFPEYADEELFTERIPFTETRDYVKILTRNIALYRGLYGG